ncbi:MAG: hypothetical protein Q8Q39_05060 [bacterium]|nr:hypothetical protein [bacterium]
MMAWYVFTNGVLPLIGIFVISAAALWAGYKLVRRFRPKQKGAT